MTTRWGRGMTARRRVVNAVLVGLVAGAIAVPIAPPALAPLVGWDVAALTYVGWVHAALWHLDAEETGRHAEREDPTLPAADLILLCSAVASLGAVGVVVVVASGRGGAAQIAEGGFAVLSVLASWAVIQTVFTLRYARLYYADEDGGADFNQSGAPRYSDFAYLAFTVGMTYQVSDTELNTSAFRANVLRHALLSYLFGTVIVALVINLVAGLSR